MKEKKTDLTIADKIIYLPLKILLSITSLFPLWATKPLANFIAFTAHYILHYRLRIVKTNIDKSYPNYTIRDINSATKEFYHHLA